MTVVLQCCQGDLGDTVIVPGSNQDSGHGPGLGFRGPGQDGVYVTVAITATGHMDYLSQPSSPQTAAGGGKLAGLSPTSCRGGVVQQLGAGQVMGAFIPSTGDDEDLDRGTAPATNHQITCDCPAMYQVQAWYLRPVRWSGSCLVVTSPPRLEISVTRE